MLYLTPLIASIFLVTIPVSNAAEGNNLRNTASQVLQDIDIEDEKFWERHLRNGFSIPPTPSPIPPFPTTPSPIPPFPAPTTPQPFPTPPTTNPPTTLPPTDLVCDGITPLQRSQQLTDIAIGTSGNINPGSPQDVALQWLIETDPFFVCPDNPKALQRYILAVFYYSTDGDNWDQCSAPDDFNSAMSIDAANDNCNVRTTPIAGGSTNPTFLPTTEGTMAWLTPTYECEWAGINCRVESECVDRIEFEDNGVGGTLPIEVRDLPDLRFFILERGTTAGPIPTEFVDIEDLLFLDLDFNELTGQIPEEIYTLTDLFQLDLNDNLLTGTLSPSIGNLSNLVFLQLAGNDFDGPIPSELGNLDQLLTGSFENNDFTGAIPDALCDALTMKPAYILIADCSPDGQNPPKVECDCCTDCFPEG
jgi:hypothetical protein